MKLGQAEKVSSPNGTAYEWHLPDRHVAFAGKSNLTVLRCLEQQIHSLERLTKTPAKPKRELALRTPSGQVLGAA